MGYTQILLETFDSKLEADTLEKLKTVAKVKKYPKGTVLCRQGEVENTFYILVEGRVASTQKLEDGDSRLLGILGPNEYFGEMGLIDDRPRFATCRALTDSTVLEITGEMFDALVIESPVVAYAITKHIMQAMRHLDELALQDLRVKNDALENAYADLQAAQEKLVAQKRLERELELAADVQRSMLPSEFQQYPGYRMAAYLEPARQVGGDLYDVIDVDDTHVGLLLADVADKGIHAAMIMAVTRTLFYTEGHRSLSPSRVALVAHKGIMEVAPRTDVFVTAFYGVLHRPSRRFTYVRAGHERPLLYRPGKPVDTLPGDGRFLGMVKELELNEYIFQLEPGDRLVLFSDGVPDAVNNTGERYGKERFAACLEKNGRFPAADIVRHIVDDVAAFSEGADPFDDLTLLVLEVKEDK